MLIISLLGIVVCVIFNARKLNYLHVILFSNVVKIMLFLSDAQYYAPVKCKMAGSIHLFYKAGKLLPQHVKLKKKIYGVILGWK